MAGKSALLRMLKGEPYKEDYEKHIYPIRGTLQLHHGKDDLQLTVECLDMTGNEKLTPVNLTLYPDASLFLLCFDLSDENSLEQLKKHHDFIIKNAHENAKILVVGTKLDEESSKNFELQETWLKENGLDWVKTSSKNNEGRVDLLNKTINLLSPKKTTPRADFFSNQLKYIDKSSTVNKACKLAMVVGAGLMIAGVVTMAVLAPVPWFAFLVAGAVLAALGVGGVVGEHCLEKREQEARKLPFIS